jgi:hypothetical protein
MDGKFRPSTLAALTSWFHRYGYPLPEVADGVNGLPLADIAQLPADSVTETSRAGLGSVVDAEHPLVRVRAKGAGLSGRADALQSDAFAVGTSVTVQVGSAAPVTSRVLAVSPFREGDTSTPAGHDISFFVPPELIGASAAGDPIVVSEALQVPEAPSVPLTAVRQSSSGAQYVLVPHGASTTQVPVTVVSQVDGYAILDAATAPTSGTLVAVSGP